MVELANKGQETKQQSKRTRSFLFFLPSYDPSNLPIEQSVAHQAGMTELQNIC